jgi:hypothetical protein
LLEAAALCYFQKDATNFPTGKKWAMGIRRPARMMDQ